MATMSSSFLLAVAAVYCSSIERLEVIPIIVMVRKGWWWWAVVNPRVRSEMSISEIF
jgi:hypothetical protein